jgi:hypothetical protein
MTEMNEGMQQKDVGTVGEIAKDVKMGNLPKGSVEAILSAAPKDLKEEWVDIPEWGYSVQLKSFTASESARIKQRGFAIREGETAVAWAEMEIMQFELGCKNPSFTNEQVRQLHLTSGPGFARVIKWLDDNSGLDKDALKKSQEELRGPNERTEVSPPTS